MTSEEKYGLIEKYLAKELEGDALKEFETQLQTDVEFKEEVLLHQQVENTLKGEKIHDVRTVLKEIDKDWEAPSQKEDTAKIVNFNFRKFLTVAAAVVLLVIGYQWFSNSNLSAQEIYASNFETYPMLLDQRSNEDEYNSSILRQAISSYSKKENTDAILAFEKLLQEDSENIIYTFYLANAHLANNETDLAITYFQKIIFENDPNFVEQSRWYLSLAHLQKSDPENAKIWLKLIQEGQFKFKEAQKILKSI